MKKYKLIVSVQICVCVCTVFLYRDFIAYQFNHFITSIKSSGHTELHLSVLLAPTTLFSPKVWLSTVELHLSIKISLCNVICVSLAEHFRHLSIELLGV